MGLNKASAQQAASGCSRARLAAGAGADHGPTRHRCRCRRWAQGRPTFHNPIYGEALYELCRRATTRQIDMPDEMLNQQASEGGAARSKSIQQGAGGGGRRRHKGMGDGVGSACR